MLKTNVVTIYCISIRGESKKDLGGKQVPKVQETSMAVRACAPGNSSFFRLSHSTFLSKQLPWLPHS